VGCANNILSSFIHSHYQYIYDKVKKMCLFSPFSFSFLPSPPPSKHSVEWDENQCLNTQAKSTMTDHFLYFLIHLNVVSMVWPLPTDEDYQITIIRNKLVQMIDWDLWVGRQLGLKMILSLTCNGCCGAMVMCVCNKAMFVRRVLGSNREWTIFISRFRCVACQTWHHSVL